MDVPAVILSVTKNGSGASTGVLNVSLGTNAGPNQLTIVQIPLTGAQCTTIATRLAQAAVGGAGSAGTDTITIAETTADAIAGGGTQIANQV